MSADPFAAERLRRAALATWRAAPSRLRQDANLEEDHARGYYRDRVVVELAQNGADAAAAAARPGHLLLRLAPAEAGWVLEAANTGAPLDASGVAAMAAMRASAKADGGTVGRFGLGFSALRSVSDEIAVRSADGAVRFSLAATAQLLATESAGQRELAVEVARRHGDLPALRLPFAVDDESAVVHDSARELAGPVPPGYTTVVRLLLRGSAEVDAVRSALAAVDDTLLLALPALTGVVLEVDRDERREIRDVAERWLTVRASGTLAPELLAGRPVEERERPAWSLTWALPRGPHALPRWLHAPTPTDEPLTLPALLLGTFPLDPARRHVAPGAVTDHLVAQAASLYGRLALEAGQGLALVPTGLPAGALDAALHEAATGVLERTAMLPEAGTGELIEPRTAQTITGPLGQDDAVLRALSPMVGGLVRVPPALRAQARAVGVAERDPADVVDTLPATGDPARLRDLYAALAPHALAEREALQGLPVLLTDGRVVRGPRGTVLLAAGQEARLPAVTGLRVVAFESAHPVLATLGAAEADAAALLERPEVRAAAEGGEVEAVLGLVAQAVADGGAVPAWLDRLPLPSADGEQEQAQRLVLPGSWVQDVLTGLVPVADETVERWGEEVLRALGVRGDVAVRVLPDVVADPYPDEEPVEGWADYLADAAATCGEGTYLGEVAVVEHLDAVADDAWQAFLARLAADPAGRAALLTPRGEGGQVLSYAAWWLREELGAPFAHPGQAVRLPFLDAPPPEVIGLDDAVLAALGAVSGAADLDAAGWQAYVDGWPEEDADLPLAQVLALWRGLATAAAQGIALEPPARVPVLDGARARLVAAEDAVVAPVMWAPVRQVVPAPAGRVAALAELLDLDVAPPSVPRAVDARQVPTPGQVRALLHSVPDEWWQCAELAIEGRPVEWWVDDGQVWATSTAGLARGMAHAAGAWTARYAAESLLAEPDRMPDILVEQVGEA